MKEHAVRNKTKVNREKINHNKKLNDSKQFSYKVCFDFIKKLYFNFLKDDMPALSAQLAYSLLFSFFPFIIFVVTLISYTNIYSLDILKNYSYLFPDIINDILLDIINKTASSRSQTTLSFSIILTLWAASGLLITLVLGEAIGNYVFNYIFNNLGIPKTVNNILLKSIWDIFRRILPVFSAFVLFTVIYRYMPSYRISFKAALPGTISSTIGWYALSLGFSYYVNNYASYSITYGSIGGIIALLIWLYWSSTIVLLGAEINSLTGANTN